MKNLKISIPISYRMLLIILLVTIPLSQIAVDIYLPSLPSMVGLFHTTKTLLQYSLSIYILAWGASQLLYGPLSDAFGRRKIIIVGTFIFLVANILTVFTSDIFTFLILRFIAGLGVGCGFVTISAIMSDAFEAKDLPTITSYIAMVYSMPVILAPVLGGYLEHYIGWQSNFVFIALYTIVVLVLVITKLPETNVYIEQNHFHWKPIASNYFTMIKDKNFVSNIFCLTMAYSIMIIFNVIGPFLLQNVLHLTPVEYGQLLLLVGVAYFLGSTVNSQLLKFFKPKSLTYASLFLMFISAIALFVADYVFGTTVFCVMLFTCLTIFATGFLFPNTYAEALSVFPEKIGSAGAFIGAFSLIGCTIVSIIVAQIHIYSERPLAFIYFVVALAAFLVFYMNHRRVGR